MLILKRLLNNITNHKCCKTFARIFTHHSFAIEIWIKQNYSSAKISVPKKKWKLIMDVILYFVNYIKQHLSKVLNCFTCVIKSCCIIQWINFKWRWSRFVFIFWTLFLKIYFPFFVILRNRMSQ